MSILDLEAKIAEIKLVLMRFVENHAEVEELQQQLRLIKLVPMKI